MSDYIVRATAANSQIRAFAAVTTDVVETARQDHNTSPVATAALGRLLTGGAMMGAMMKGEKDIRTLQVKGDGPIQGQQAGRGIFAQVGTAFPVIAAAAFDGMVILPEFGPWPTERPLDGHYLRVPAGSAVSAFSAEPVEAPATLAFDAIMVRNDGLTEASILSSVARGATKLSARR